jgi:hypothetical protein
MRLDTPCLIRTRNSVGVSLHGQAFPGRVTLALRVARLLFFFLADKRGQTVRDQIVEAYVFTLFTRSMSALQISHRKPVTTTLAYTTGLCIY